MEEKETNLHRRKRSKNLTVLAIILGWCALIWLITMVRIAHGQEMPETSPKDSSEVFQTEESLPHDLEYFFSNSRSRHQSDMDSRGQQLHERGKIHQSAMDKATIEYHDRGTNHQDAMDSQLAAMTDQGAMHQAGMDEAANAYQEKAMVHQQGIAANPDTWWSGWKDRLFPADYGDPAQQ